MAKDKPKNGAALAEENLKRIREMQHNVRMKEAEVEEAKGEYKLAKQMLELERGKLSKLIEVTEAGSSDPLFKEAEEAKPCLPLDLEGDESWKDVRLEEVFSGLTKGLQGKVADASLVTMHDITEWCKHKQLTDIPGVGQANADKLQNAMDEFWQRRKEAAAEAGVAEQQEEAPAANGQPPIPVATAEPMGDDGA